MSDGININELPLPAALVRAIRNGVWRTPKNREVWLSLFPARQVVQPMLYPLEKFDGKRDLWFMKAGPVYYGSKHSVIEPGDIDPYRAVLIGDLGPDRLIALDYRPSLVEPTVVALTSDRNSCWRIVADDIKSFMRAIKLVD